MTPEQLDAAFRAGDSARCVQLLLNATEAERRAAVDTVLGWWNVAMAASHGEAHPEQAAYQSALDPWKLKDLVAFCLHGTGTWSQIRHVNWWLHPPYSDLIFDVLRVRRPTGLGEWAGQALEDSLRWWPHVRRLVREGFCARPKNDAYILGMIEHLWPADSDRRQPAPRVRDGLLADPELMEYEVWRLFEVEGGGENSLAARDKYTHPVAQWTTGLVMLAVEGHLSRDRLLTASLEALVRDFAPFRAGWFSRFHEALAPTVAERQARQEHYLMLLGSTVPATVAFTIKALAILDKEKLLPGEALLEHIAPALFARTVGTVKQALRLIDRAAQCTPALRTRAAVVATEALAHESPEAQAAALSLIERHGSRDDATLRERLQVQAEGIVASQRSRLAPWLGTPAVSSAEDLADEAAVQDLFARGEVLSPELAALAGVPAAVAAVCSEARAIPALEMDPARIPRLDPAARLTPINDLEELLDAFAAALENEGPPDEIERVLDGVSRLCAARPADFARRTGPLRKRARALLATEGEAADWSYRAGEGVFGGRMPRRDLCGLALAWIDGEWCGAAEVRGSLGGFLATRVAAVARRAIARQPRPLLAAPTHAGGWIDPRVLVARMGEPQGVDADPLDLIQALLRLAPDGRGHALEAAQRLEGETGAAVRYALGGTVVAIGPSAPLWVASARARDADADDLAVEARHPGLGPHAGRAPRVELRRNINDIDGFIWPLATWHYAEWPSDLPQRPPDRYTPKPQAGGPLELPSVLHHLIFECDYSGEFATLRRWAATVWPAGREAWCLGGARIMVGALDGGGGRWGDQVFLEPLLEPDAPLGAHARQLLALGLAAREPGQSGVATDVLIAAVTDGRLDGARLAGAMAPFLELGVVMPARWARTLGEAARVSPLHATVVRDALEGALPDEPPARPGDMVPPLQLLHELCLQTGAAIHNAQARGYLSAFKGSGKAAQLAKTLLALPDTPNPAHDRAAALVALEGRLERAERWQRYGE